MPARKTSGTSIRVLLGCVIGLMGLILLGVGSQPLHDALVAYPAARRLAVVTEISHDLFDALANYRFERGGMLASLAAEEPVRPEQRAQIVKSRDAGEQGYQKAVAMMGKLDITGLEAVLAHLQQTHQKVSELRAGTERAASLPKAERTPGLGKTLAATGDAYLDALAAATDLIDATIRMRDPVIEALVVVKRQGWVARSAAGDESSVVSVALAAARPWGSEQIRKAAEAAGRKRAAWNVVAEVATRAGASPGLKSAYDNALSHYFGKDQVARQPVEDALNAGRLPDITATAWQGLALPSLESLGAPCMAALDDMMAAAREGVTRATEHLIMAVAAMSAGLALIVAGFCIVQFRVCVPMIALTKVMLRLADGDYAATVPGADRHDELGSMARAVQTFRENGIRMQRLEAEAAAQRAQTEAERAATAQHEAARAAEQAAVVEALAAGLAGLAEGDLTCEIAREFAPDYARLRADFNAAVSGLRTTVQEIKRRSDVIGSGTSEIATAADDLAQRTEQQAASLEQTAAALDQVTAAVRQTAIGSGQAQTIAAGALDEAEQSGNVVSDAVQAMGEIEGSARQIGQIIGVIDEIAFQTNLLALNAGVEAARAGESGRGFAVIATEVRALAQRAADAARQIKTLITTSMRQVEQGVRLVDATGEALGRIRSGVSQINISISEIAASAREQATGLAEINIAVNQMDHTTQQNAAMVEQSTAATRSLARETEELTQSMSRFRIEAEWDRAIRRAA